MEKDKKNAQSNAGKKQHEFTIEEKAAMRARVRELKGEANKAAGENAALEAIEKMKEPDRSIAGRLHQLIKAIGLSAKTWYGMPAYANSEGKIICYFRDRYKFKERYAMFGFNDSASLDEGSMWPVAYAVPDLTKDDEKRIAALVKKAVTRG